jgi:hypothetical protein
VWLQEYQLATISLFSMPFSKFERFRVLLIKSQLHNLFSYESTHLS